MLNLESLYLKIKNTLSEIYNINILLTHAMNMRLSMII